MVWLLPSLFIYLFTVIYFYSAFSTVQCSNALYRLWDGEIQGHTGQPSVREIDAHTAYNQWATAPGRSLNYPRLKSITHLCTFSDNGVYVDNYSPIMVHSIKILDGSCIYICYSQLWEPGITGNSWNFQAILGVPVTTSHYRYCLKFSVITRNAWN